MMEKDDFEEKISCEDNVKLFRLVDYGSSSEDEDHAPLVKNRRLTDLESNTSSHADDDESPAAPMKKQGLIDSELNTSSSENEAAHMKKQCANDSEMNSSLSCNGSSNSVSEDFDNSEPWIVDYDTASDDSVGNDFFIETDNDLLDFGPYSWRTGDTWNKREEYIVVVEGKREESKCLEMLNVIGCEERFLGCSVEMSRIFFAQLNEDEANKLKGVKGVRKVIPRRGTYSAI